MVEWQVKSSEQPATQQQPKPNVNKNTDNVPVQVLTTKEQRSKLPYLDKNVHKLQHT